MHFSLLIAALFSFNRTSNNLSDLFVSPAPALPSEFPSPRGSLWNRCLSCCWTASENWSEPNTHTTESMFSISETFIPYGCTLPAPLFNINTNGSTARALIDPSTPPQWYYQGEQSFPPLTHRQPQSCKKLNTSHGNCYPQVKLNNQRSYWFQPFFLNSEQIC